MSGFKGHGVNCCVTWLPVCVTAHGLVCEAVFLSPSIDTATAHSVKVVVQNGAFLLLVVLSMDKLAF